MRAFELREVCNKLLADLNRSSGKQNIMKLGIDIQLPEEFYGDPALLVNPVRIIADFLSARLINGIISIEITLNPSRHGYVVLRIVIEGHGSSRRNLTDGSELRDFIDSLDRKIDYEIADDQITIEFDHSFRMSGSGEDGAHLYFRNKRLLLAEDNEINALVFLSFLEEWGLDSVVAVNGEEAIASVHNSLFAVDVILMDIHMPVLNGIQAIRKIREFNLTVPIIALTASTGDNDIRQAMEAGANDYLLKPVSSTSLFQTLSKYL